MRRTQTLAAIPRLAVWIFMFASVQLLAVVPAFGRPPSDEGERNAVIGQPTALVVEPASISLTGPRSLRQLVVSGKYADGSVRDLTPFSTLAFEAAGIAGAEASGFITPLKDGSTTLIVKAGAQTVRVPVVVKDFSQPEPISFRHQVVAALSVGGCNQGACHGTPSGKNGFRLSLRGYDPASDHVQLTRDVLGRRTDRLDPEASLIYQKALGRVPHEGGQRYQPRSLPAEVVRNWLAEGLQDDPATLPALQSLDVLPGNRVLNAPARWQQLSVLAHFSDGKVRDVTRLTVFSSSDAAIADVNANGLVEFGQSGEVAILCRYLDQLKPVRLTYLEPRPGFVWNNPPQTNYVDKLVFEKLRMMNILPSDLCSDAEFIRRAYLDLCGILPPPDVTRTFLNNTEKDKRAKLIDRLLETPEYADFWTLKWSDVLRSNRKTIQLKGIHVYQQWLRRQIGENAPFDQMVRELLTANGSTFSNPPANFYRIARDPTSLAETTAQLFFGIRLQCAKCHNHPFERWTQDDYYSFAAFFARVRQKKDSETTIDPKAPGAEVIFSDRAGEMVQPRTSKTMAPKFMGGATPAIPKNTDRRLVLAEWLTSSNNPFFGKSVANRIWFHLLGRGIVDPVDDFRDSNPSANDALLEALARDFAEHHYDARHIVRTIMTSRTYQLSAQTNATNKEDVKYFSHIITKQYSAEQLLDAICTVTGMPEKYAGLPLGTRAVQLPDGEFNHVFLKTFGQPGRELACECERESDSNLAQALQFINGPTVHGKVKDANNRLGQMLTKKVSDGGIMNELFVVALSRQPEPDEIKAISEHLAKTPDKRKAWEDVLWALINSKEFRFRH